MPEYYQNVSLNLRNVDEIDFGFYYDSKKHRYTISLNYGEEYLNVTRREGEVILSFLRILNEFIDRARSKDLSSRSDSREVEKTFDSQGDRSSDPDDEDTLDFLETDPVLRNVRLSGKTEI